MLPVRNGTGVKNCGDITLNVNRAIIEEKVSLRKVEDLYASPAVGPTYSILDFSRVYKQVMMDEEMNT
jgi:hypothetical protein